MAGTPCLPGKSLRQTDTHRAEHAGTIGTGITFENNEMVPAVNEILVTPHPTEHQ
jgi:hypothetical protein